MLPLLHLAAPLAAAGLLCWAAASDLRRFVIPNAASLALVAAFALFALTLPEAALVEQKLDLAGFASGGGVAFASPKPAFDLVQHLTVGGVALVLGLLAFVLRLAGGGDGKLFAAVALWAGPERLLPALFIMALVGGLLALAQVLTLQQARARSAGRGLLAVGLPSRAELGQAPVPYGVAIAGAGLYVLWGLAAPLL